VRHKSSPPLNNYEAFSFRLDPANLRRMCNHLRRFCLVTLIVHKFHDGGLVTVAFLVVMTLVGNAADNPQEIRPHARDLGLKIGVLQPGPWNAITDVPGIKV
jgi:hypothetical protein